MRRKNLENNWGVFMKKRIFGILIFTLCFFGLYSQSLEEQLLNSMTNYESGIYLRFIWTGENSDIKVQVESQFYGLCKQKAEKVPTDYYETFPRLPLKCTISNKGNGVLSLNKTDSFQFTGEGKTFDLILDGNVDTYPERLAGKTEQKFLVQSPSLYYPFSMVPNIDAFIVWSGINIKLLYGFSAGLIGDMTNEEFLKHLPALREKANSEEFKIYANDIYNSCPVKFIYGQKGKEKTLELKPALDFFEIK